MYKNKGCRIRVKESYHFIELMEFTLTLDFNSSNKTNKKHRHTSKMFCPLANLVSAGKRV